MRDNVIPLTDRELVREHLESPPGVLERIREATRGVLGPEHDPTRCRVCSWCRKSAEIGELEMIAIFAHPKCAARIHAKSAEPINVFEDVTAIASVVAIAGVAVMFVIAPIARWFFGIVG